MPSPCAEPTTERRMAGPPARVWSITARLTVLYTISTGGLLLLAIMFLYWVFDYHLARESHQFLADKVHVLRAILQDAPQDHKALVEEVQWEAATHQHITYYRRSEKDSWPL